MAHALVIHVTIDPSRTAEAEGMLQTQVVPMTQSLPGYTGSYHMASLDGSRGLGTVLFDSEEHAKSAAQALADNAPPEGGPVKIAETEIFDVRYRS